MQEPTIPINEAERLQALQEFSILDTLPEKEYDEITYLASFITGTPISLISLIDDKRQWFKSHYGIEARETPKEVAFCAHAINDKDNMMVVPDSRTDKRFHDNPLVTDDPHVIFYAGVPLVTNEGFPLGTLCVIDNKPNSLTKDQEKALKALSNQLMSLFEARKNAHTLESRNIEIANQNKSLQDFARVAAHDIKSPLSTIVMITDFLENNYSEQLDQKAFNYINEIGAQSLKLTQMIDGILTYTMDARALHKNKEIIHVSSLIQDITHRLEQPENARIEVKAAGDIQILTNKTALEQILINLVSNSIKYNDKSTPEIRIIANETKDRVEIQVHDNGPGIAEEDQQRIFNIFETTNLKDTKGKHGSGIGLATVKSLIDALGGTIKVESPPGQGATFTFSLPRK